MPLQSLPSHHCTVWVITVSATWHTHTHLYNPPPSLQHVHWLLGSPLLVFMSLGADSKWNIYCPLVGMTASMPVHVQICAAGSCAHVHTNQAWQVPIKQSCFYESYPQLCKVSHLARRSVAQSKIRHENSIQLWNERGENPTGKGKYRTLRIHGPYH